MTYLPFGDGGKPYRQKIQSLHTDLELGESYAIIAYGGPAAVVLDVAHKPMPHLCALIAYYPPTITQPKTKYPPHVEYQIHLAMSQQGKLEVPPDLPIFWYPDTKEGFAESDLDEWDNVASGLAWTRMLGAVRKGFKAEKNLEDIVDRYHAGECGLVKCIVVFFDGRLIRIVLSQISKEPRWDGTDNEPRGICELCADNGRRFGHEGTVLLL